MTPTPLPIGIKAIDKVTIGALIGVLTGTRAGAIWWPAAPLRGGANRRARLRDIALAMPIVLALIPGPLWADGLTATDPIVPLAPPGAMAHAAYFTLTNTGSTSRRLIGVQADGYAMAHLHRSEDSNGVATMSAVHQIDLEPGQSVVFAPGGLHVMMMHPSAPLAVGGRVEVTLHFDDGETLLIAADVVRIGHGS